jgi:hypothetical protein
METKHTKIRLKIKLINCGRLPFFPPHIFETVRTTTNVFPYCSQDFPNDFNEIKKKQHSNLTPKKFKLSFWVFVTLTPFI